MAEAAPRSAEREGALRFLAFRMADRLYALPASEVAEVIRMPLLARVPLAHKSLLGLANLRGSVLPVVSLRGLLGSEISATDPAMRAIVLDGLSPVALAVDRVAGLIDGTPDGEAPAQAALAAAPGEMLRGAFRGRDGQDLIRILDIKGLLSSAFVERTRLQCKAQIAGVAAKAIDPKTAAHDQKLVTFEVGGQEFALSLDVVQEIVTVPGSVMLMPRSETPVLGVASHRDGLLPLLSLRGLLGFAPSASAERREKVIVTRVGGVLAGLVADRMRAIVAADPALIEAIPHVLAARAGGEARLKAIYRHEAGRRLISILDPDLLFRDDIMRRLGEARGARQSMVSEAGKAEAVERRFLLFRLGADEFGLPIEAVDEVARVPEQITRVPKTPKFLEGVINLRGAVLPVIDQRRRFDLPKREEGVRRLLIVVRSAQYRAGLIVDDVSEVLRRSADALLPAPELSGDITRLVSGVINLKDAGRMILILNPAELLSKTERSQLDAFDAQEK